VTHARQQRAATLRSSSFDADANTIDVVWTTGAAVRRSDPFDGEFDEILSLDPGAVRLGRLNAGAPFLDSHDGMSVARILGSVVPGSAKIDTGQQNGVATIQLSRARADADTVQKIRDGVIRNVSVGYLVHHANRVDGGRGEVDKLYVTDWEPVEVSAVPIPADPGAQIRSLRSSAATGRIAAIRQKAARAGVVKFGEEHVRLGTSESAFTKILLELVMNDRNNPASRERRELARGTGHFARLAKRKPTRDGCDDDDDETEAGEEWARNLLGRDRDDDDADVGAIVQQPDDLLDKIKALKEVAT
jgi:phage head maturation protease